MKTYARNHPSLINFSTRGGAFKRAVGVFLLSLVALATAPAQDPTGGRFTRTADMTSPRERHTSTLLPGPDGKVLVTGGNRSIGQDPTNTAELFDPKASPPSFTPLPQMISARAEHTATLLADADGKVLLAGGTTTAGVVTNTAELFNPVLGAFTPVLPMITQRTGHTATRLPDGKVLITGGDMGSAPGGTGQICAPASKIFPPIFPNTMQGPQYYHRPTGSTEQFDPASGAFTALSCMNVERAGHTATLILAKNGKPKVLITGGAINSEGAVTNTAELFDPEAETFTPVLPMLIGRTGHTATLLQNGKVLVAGGTTTAGLITNTAELFDPTLGRFIPVLPGMLEMRSDHAAALLPDGRVLIAGGNTLTGPTDTGELFDPTLGIFLPLLPELPSLENKMEEPRYYHRPTLVVMAPFGPELGGPRVLITGGITKREGALEVTASAELFKPPQKATDGMAGWAIVASPGSGTLRDVTCISASDCWAVGPDNGLGILIQRWDGIEWTIVPAPSVGDEGGTLNAVTCVAADNCWAVGRAGPQNGLATQRTLILHWNGIAWSVVTSPNVDPNWINQLWEVTCTSASNCWAVGSYTPSVNSGSLTLILRWNGSSWAIFPSPNPIPPRPSSADDIALMGVTCVSASDCWAVGYYSHYHGDRGHTLIERWDGIAWAIVPSPGTGDFNSLSDVTCASATDCWAVGSHIERWDGTSWLIVPSPNPPGSSLLGVTCASASDCWAVGWYSDDDSFTVRIEKWDGSQWSTVPLPDTSTSQLNFLHGVTCASASDCWAVGSYFDMDTAPTLIMRFTARLVSVVSRKTHGNPGTDFNINLPLSGPAGIECRTGGATGDHQVVFSFANPVTVNGSPQAEVTSGTGEVGTGGVADPSGTVSITGSDLTVPLTNVTNEQTIVITLFGVDDGIAPVGNLPVAMGILAGDTTANGSVNSSDISQTKSKSGQAVTGANFRQDVTINGSINSSDISLVKSKSGTALP